MKWAVFISGFGSNLQALLDFAATDTDGNTTVNLVVSNKPEVYGLERAKKHNVPVYILPKPITSQDWQALTDKLRAEKIDKIFLLGFLRILPPEFVKAWEHKILNLHPSLLPAYPGLHSIEKSYQEKAPMGVTVHWVTEGLDEGAALLQESIEYNQLTLEQAEEKIHKLEHKLVIEAVKICQKKQEY